MKKNKQNTSLITKSIVSLTDDSLLNQTDESSLITHHASLNQIEDSSLNKDSSLITHHSSLNTVSSLNKDSSLSNKSKEYRKKILKYIYNAKAGHTGGSLSIIDILNVLYNEILNVSPENFHSNLRDRYIQSKGHCVEALYVVLADKGFFPEEDLLTLCQYNSPYIGHPTKYIPGMEQNTGALGHGLAMCAGMALAAKKDKSPVKVFTVLGDGEMAEGSNWEALMFAAHYKLDNLCAILDYNKLQITATNAEVMGLEPIDKKLEAFGWSVIHVDGHNLEELSHTFKRLPLEQGKPSFVIAHTIKGKGVSYMENQIKWHHGVPSAEQYELAMQELS